MRIAVLVVLAACGKGAEEPAPVARPIEKPKPPPIDAAPAAPDAPVATCVAADDGRFDTATITPAAAAFCVSEDARRSCWKVDLATGTYTAAAVTPPPPEPDSPLTNATVQPDGSVKLCPTSTCTEFRARKFSAADQAAVSDDGKILARMAADADTRIELYDVATGKFITKLRSWKTLMGNPAPLDMLTFAGDDRILMWAHATPISDSARIYTRSGHFIGRVGPSGFTQNSVDTWHVADSQWAFKQIDDTQLIVVDLATGRRTQTFDLRPIAIPDHDGDSGDRAAVGAVAVFGDTIVYVSAAGRIGLLDRRSGGIRAFIPPACRAH